MQNSSLRRQLLRRLLLPLMPIMLVGVAMAYAFAVRAANDANDLGLMDDALDLAKQVEMRQGKMQLELPLAAQQMLLANNDDQVSYAAWDEAGKLIAGDAQLLRLGIPSTGENHLFRDVVVGGRKNRVVVLDENVNGRPVFIAVAQTVHGRDRLFGEIFVSMLLPEFALAIVAVFVILFGVRSGLSPVEMLRDEILNRSPNDLRPIEEAPAPAELRPIVHGINVLLEKLTLAFASQKRFIADAAHQLRTPLAALGSQIEVGLEKSPTDARETLRQLLATTHRTSHLANQLLSLARLEHAEQTFFAHTDVELYDVIREAAGDFVIPASNKGIELDFDLQPCRIHGNALLLRELLANLFDNAVCYVPAGGHVWVKLRSQRSQCQLTVEDDGPGVPEHELGMLGVPFHRPPSNLHDGCGLGLAIAKEIARLHSAAIAFGATASGSGLRIDVSFPRPKIA